MKQYHLAQANIARLVAPLDSAELAGFVNNMAAVNAIADSSKGFVWRMQDESGGSTSLLIFNDKSLLLNVSVWEDIDALYNYVYKSQHGEYFAQRRRWFRKWEGSSPVLWWIEAGQTPTIAVVEGKFRALQERGASASAFNFKNRFALEDYLATLEDFSN